MENAKHQEANKFGLLAQRFARVRKHTEDIVRTIEAEDSAVQAALFVSPPKWHLGHTSWFFEEFVLATRREYIRYNSHYAYLFNSYYNQVGARTPRFSRGMQTRPTLKELLEYRKWVTEAVITGLENEQFNSEVLSLIELGIQHEQQHQELLLTDIKYILGTQHLKPVCDFNYLKSKDEHPHIKGGGFLEVEGGVYSIGYEGASFHFDNENPIHKTLLNDFRIGESLVSNGHYMQFMEDGGYENALLWLDEGWTWLQGSRISSPLYWELINGQWMHYTLDGLRPVHLDTPLTHISYYEADAFANWLGKRLPTEFEWEVASDKFDWGDRWEWTCSSYEGYPGFRIAPGAIGEYNGKFMINQRVLRGASFATPKGHSRKTYRNFFHPDMRWQYTGLRLAERV